MPMRAYLCSSITFLLDSPIKQNGNNLIIYLCTLSKCLEDLSCKYLFGIYSIQICVRIHFQSVKNISVVNIYVCTLSTLGRSKFVKRYAMFSCVGT